MLIARAAWTDAQDFRLRRMRLEGAAWEAIAEALSVSAAAAMARAGRIGARPAREAVPASEDPAREPLPAGHPRAWAVLTAGTWLAGTRYPASPDAGRSA